MQVVDYLVTQSLEVNNRCLRYLAECDPLAGKIAGQIDGLASPEFSADAQTVYAESLLARESRRLLALWGLIDPIHGTTDFDSHLHHLSEASQILSEATVLPRLALRLASIAPDDDEAKALLELARALPASEGVRWELLNDLFTLDSQLWRSAIVREVNDDSAICHRAGRSYRKAFKRARKLQAHMKDGGSMSGWLAEYGEKFGYWTGLMAYQSELFRPGLSEKGKSQAWYADKLADSLRMRHGFLALIEGLAQGHPHLSTGAQVLASKFAEQQLDKMDKRIGRLLGATFNVKPKKFLVVLEKSLTSLGIQQIATISPVTVGSADEGLQQS